MSRWMSKAMKVYQTIKNRWQAESPKIFRRIYQIGATISVGAIGWHTAVSAIGIDEPQWLLTILPYLIGIPAGMAAVAKITIKDNSHEDRNQENVA